MHRGTVPIVTPTDEESGRGVALGTVADRLVDSATPHGRWLLVGAGVVLLTGSELLVFVAGSTEPAIRLLELLLPISVGVGLVWYGFAVTDHEFSSWQIAVLGLAVLLGMGLFVVLATYMQVLLSLEESVPPEPLLLLLNAMALGAIVNLAYASHYVRLHARTERLRTRTQRLTAIVSRASHDLRNPLNVAQGYADLLAEDVADTDRIEPLTDALDRIDALIDELVVFASIERSEPDSRSVSLEAVARESWSMVDTGKGVLVVEEDLHFRANPKRLRHLLENLFRNAAEHAGPDPTVRIGSLPDAPGFFVADDGQGIPPPEREVVFDPGYTTSEEGTGLGLDIVAEICDRQGWSIAVTASESGGTRFEIKDVSS
jgi:two-component system sensor histidine kinase HydH